MICSNAILTGIGVGKEVSTAQDDDLEQLQECWKSKQGFILYRQPVPLSQFSNSSYAILLVCVVGSCLLLPRYCSSTIQSTLLVTSIFCDIMHEKTLAF